MITYKIESNRLKHPIATTIFSDINENKSLLTLYFILFFLDKEANCIKRATPGTVK